MGNCLSSEPKSEQQQEFTDLNRIDQSEEKERAPQEIASAPQGMSVSNSTPIVAQPAAATPASQPAAAPARKRTDFMAKQLQNAFVLKQPGSLEGKQFMITDCNKCDIYIFDATATVTIDRCQDCRIFIGPCESSVFFRDCARCNVVVVAQQLRMRDCIDFNVFVYVSAGQPVIESSHHIRFGTFVGDYVGFDQHMSTAKLDPYSGSWSNIHDFHQASAVADAAQGKWHWKMLPPVRSCIGIWFFPL